MTNRSRQARPWPVRGLGLVATAMAAASLLASASEAAPVRKAAAPASAKRAGLAGHPADFSGVWQLPEGVSRAFDASVRSPYDQKPPFKAPWGDEWNTIKKRFQAGMRVWDATVRCLPPGMPRTMNASYPFEILTNPGRVTVLTEFFNETRRIWTDGRRHPPEDELEPTFSGHSVAHWEGDTLVVDTVGLRFETTVDLVLIPHSDQLRITERIRRVKPDELEWTITLDDPVVFERPWTSVKRYVRAPAGSEVREFVCSENDQFDPYQPSPDDAKYMQADPRLKTKP